MKSDGTARSVDIKKKNLIYSFLLKSNLPVVIFIQTPCNQVKATETPLPKTVFLSTRTHIFSVNNSSTVMLSVFWCTRSFCHTCWSDKTGFLEYPHELPCVPSFLVLVFCVPHVGRYCKMSVFVNELPLSQAHKRLFYFTVLSLGDFVLLFYQLHQLQWSPTCLPAWKRCSSIHNCCY